MRINGFRCDGCGKEHLLSPTLIVQSTHAELPEGWYMAVCGPYRSGPGMEDPWVFCSIGCVWQWAKNQLTANDLSVSRQDLGDLREKWR